MASEPRYRKVKGVREVQYPIEQINSMDTGHLLKTASGRLYEVGELDYARGRFGCKLDYKVRALKKLWPDGDDGRCWRTGKRRPTDAQFDRTHCTDWFLADITQGEIRAGIREAKAESEAKEAADRAAHDAEMLAWSKARAEAMSIFNAAGLKGTEDAYSYDGASAGPGISFKHGTFVFSTKDPALAAKLAAVFAAHPAPQHDTPDTAKEN